MHVHSPHTYIHERKSQVLLIKEKGNAEYGGTRETVSHIRTHGRIQSMKVVEGQRRMG